MVMSYGEMRLQLENLITLTEDGLIWCLQALHSDFKIGLKFKQVANSSQIFLIKIPSK